MDIVLNYGDNKVRVLGSKDEPYFSGKDVCRILDVKDHKQTLRYISDEDKQRCLINTPKKKCVKMTFVNEVGLYEIIFKSRCEGAKKFRRWIFSEVLPSIRKYGKYPMPEYCNTSINSKKIINIQSEKDLHYEVVKFIKNQLGSPFCMCVGLGEMQTTPEKRIEAARKGFRPGLPDILITSSTDKYHGLALELKTPVGSGELSEEQKKTLDEFRDEKYKIIISNDFHEIIYKLTKYKIKMEQYDDNQKKNIKRCYKCDKEYKFKRCYIKHLESCL